MISELTKVTRLLMTTFIMIVLYIVIVWTFLNIANSILNLLQ